MPIAWHRPRGFQLRPLCTLTSLPVAYVNVRGGWRDEAESNSFPQRHSTICSGRLSPVTLECCRCLKKESSYIPQRNNNMSESCFLIKGKAPSLSFSRWNEKKIPRRLFWKKKKNLLSREIFNLCNTGSPVSAARYTASYKSNYRRELGHKLRSNQVFTHCYTFGV